MMLILAVIIFVLVIGYIQTAWVMTRPSQAVFLAGTVPQPAMDGPYKGTADGYLGAWKGKKLEAATSTGINLFDENGQTVEKFKFKTYAGKGLKDKSLDVMKIDYNVAGNPFWLKMIVDEVVQSAPGKYLGKVHIRPVPGIVFTLTYFHLEK